MMEIRKLVPGELSEEQFLEIVEIERNCGLEPFPPLVLESDLFCEENWAAMDDKHIMAFITVSTEEGYFDGDLFIFNLNVRKDMRNMGLATGLLRAALNAHPECPAVSLDVRTDNEKAMNLYRKLGFLKTETESLNGESDIVMRAPREKVLSV